jgi:hypothetical protein
MRNVSDKAADRIKTHILGSIPYFSENISFYELMWKKIWNSQTGHR